MERSTTVGALSQLKSSRQPKILYELCPGYLDGNGIWNNGFHCPKWGHPESNYCCGDAEERICCPEPDAGAGTTVSMSDSSGSDSQVRHHVIAGVLAGVVVILSLVLLISCCFCRCCPGYKKRTRQKPSIDEGDSSKESTSLRPRTMTPTPTAPLIPVSSDWTSVPTDWTTSDDEGGSRAFGLHCGCRWSPNHHGCSAAAAAAAASDFRIQTVDIFDDFFDPCQSPVAAHHHLPPHHHHQQQQHLQHHHNRMHCVECLPTVDAPSGGFVRRCPVV